VTLAAAAAVVAVLVVPSAEARAATPAGFFGLNFSFPDITNKDVLYLKASGAKTVRWTMNWSHIEPSSGSWHWSATNKLVGDLAAQGIRVLPVMWGSPRWVASSAITPPVGTQKQRDAWSGFLRAAIKRYGPGGNYWRGGYRKQHPGKTALPINTWQIWNEANLKSAMNPPKPATYAQLLTLSHTVIKQTDAKARVMFAGLLSHPPNGYNAWTFLRHVYHQPGARNSFDIMASNAYSSSVSGMLDDLNHIRQTMAANGQGPKPLWISEVGWGSAPVNAANGGQTKGMQGQKQVLVKAFNALEQKRSVWRIGKVLWFNFRDPAGGNSKICGYCTSAGLLTNAFQRKPAWSAFLNFSG
jgi:polysaccharide biosynthesis protein PslG